MPFSDPDKSEFPSCTDIYPPFSIMSVTTINPDNYYSTVFIDSEIPISRSEKGQKNDQDNIPIERLEDEANGKIQQPYQENHNSETDQERETKPQQTVGERAIVSGSDENLHQSPRSPKIDPKRVTFLPEEKVLLKQLRHHYSKATPRMTISEIAEKVYKKVYISEGSHKKINRVRQQILRRFNKEGRNCRTCKQIQTYYYNQNKRGDVYEISAGGD